MRIELNDKFCAAIKPGEAQTDYLDTKLPGLSLRVSKHGVKAWSLINTQNGKTQRLRSCGHSPQPYHGCDEE